VNASALRGAAPVFVVRDVGRAVQYYRDALGFRVGFTYGEPVHYAGVERDHVLIHLQAATETTRAPGQSSIYVFVTDVDTLYAELQGRGARALKEPRDFPYGMRDFDAEDLDGNHLGFGMETPAR
jgi:uncharacterized glyoxalase superfamily protein PhnB